MISLEKEWYGTFLMVDLPFMDHAKGIGYGSDELMEEIGKE